MRRVSRPGRLILSTVTIGVMVGIGAAGFHLVADRFGDILFAWVESQTAASRLPFVLIVPTVGLGLVGLILQYYPQSRVGGVREVYESLERHAGVIPFEHQAFHCCIAQMFLIKSVKISFIQPRAKIPIKPPRPSQHVFPRQQHAHRNALLRRIFRVPPVHRVRSGSCCNTLPAPSSHSCCARRVDSTKESHGTSSPGGRDWTRDNTHRDRCSVDGPKP